MDNIYFKYRMNFDKNGSPIGKWNTTIRNASYSQQPDESSPMYDQNTSQDAMSVVSFRSVPPSVEKRAEENWWNVSSPLYKKWKELREFRMFALESQLAEIISRITELSRSVEYDTPPSPAYSFIEESLVIDTIKEQLDKLKPTNPEIEEKIYRVNGKSNVIDVSHDLTKVYRAFLNILETLDMDETIKHNLIVETEELLENIKSSQSTKFVPEKGHTEFKKLINELINYLLENGVRFNEFLLEPTAVMRDDIKLVIPQDLECFSESGSKEITDVRLDGRLCTNADCGSGTAHPDRTNPIQVCTFPNIFNAVSYRMTSTLNEDNSITHQIIAYVETDSGLFFEIYNYNGGVSLNSVVELIGMLGERFVTDIKCALRSCGDESDEKDVKSNISELGSYYVSDANVIQKLVQLFMDDKYINFSQVLLSPGLNKLTDLSQYLTQAFCCRAGLKTIGDLSSRVVIQKGGYLYDSGDSGIFPKVFGTVDKFCGESCLMWVLSGYISGLEYICMKSKKNYEVYKIPKNDSESLKKNLSFIFNVDLEGYEKYCRNKYLTFINTAVRKLSEKKKKSLTKFESIQYDILKIIEEKYENRFLGYYDHLKKTKALVIQTVSDINNRLVLSKESTQNISNMLLAMSDESYINPSFDINELLNEYTMFSDLGSTELQYKLDSKNIKNFQGYTELKQLLTVSITHLKITNNMVEQILDILLTLYTTYTTYGINEKTFSEFCLKNINSINNEGEYNLICLTLLGKVDEKKILHIISSYIDYIRDRLTTEPDAKGKNKSLFDFLTSGSQTKTRDDLKIEKIDIVGDDIILGIINDRHGLTHFFEKIGLPKIDDDVTNWTICNDDLTIPVTIELLLNLREYITGKLNSNNKKQMENNNEKIKIIDDNINERVEKIKKKINPKLVVERGRGTTKQDSVRDISRSRSRDRENPNSNSHKPSGNSHKPSGNSHKPSGPQPSKGQFHREGRTLKKAGSKSHKPKFTRRKNKKSPKRKTIKKRKMPKRKNKTRRQRK